MALSGSELEKEVNKVKKFLGSNEEIILITKQTRLGLAGGSLVTPNTLILTNEKIIIRNPKTLGLREEVLTIPLERITAIRMGKGVLKGEILINAPGLSSEIHRFFKSKQVTEEIGIPGIPKEDAEKIVNYVQQRLSDMKRGSSTNTYVSPSPLDELKKLKELMDMGVITKEEFEKKKEKLLSKL